MAASFISSAAKLCPFPKRNCFISLPQFWLRSVVHYSVHTFLLKNTSGAECYVSWSGDTHQCEDPNEPTVLLNYKLITSNNFNVGETIIVTQIPVPLPCERLSVAVDDVTDWENLALNADVAQLEFLQQARVVFPGQKIPLWLEGGVCVTMTVLSVVPATVCGLLLPLTYVEVVPPSQSDQHQGVRPVAFNPTSSETTLDPYSYGDATMSDDSQHKNDHGGSNLFSLLVEAMTRNIINKNKKLIPVANFKMKLQLRVTPMPCFSNCENKPSHPLSNAVIISRDSLTNSALEKSTFFLAKFKQLNSLAPHDPAVDNKFISVSNTEDKEEQEGRSEWVYCMVVVWENFKKARDVGHTAMASALDKQVMGHYALIPDSVRRLQLLKLATLIHMDTQSFPMRSLPVHIEVYPLSKVRPEQHQAVCYELQAALATQCQLSDTVINHRSLFRLTVEGRQVEVIAVLRDETPLVLTRESVALLTVRILHSLDHVPFIARTTSDLDSPPKLVSVKEFVSDATLLENLHKDYLVDLGLTHSHMCDPQFALIQGEPASGKTSLVQALSRKLSSAPFFVHCEYLSMKPLIGKKAETVEKKLLALTHRSQVYRPALVILDDLDSLCPASNPGESAESGVLFDHHYQLVAMMTRVLELVRDHNSTSAADGQGRIGNVCVVATCSARSALDERLSSVVNSSIMFPKSYSMPTATDEGRINAFKQILVSRLKDSLSDGQHLGSDALANMVNIKETALAKLTEGFKSPDLNHLAMRTALLFTNKLVKEAAQRKAVVKTPYTSKQIQKVLGGESNPSPRSVTVTEEDVAAAAVGFTPLALKDMPSTAASSSGASLGVGGLHSARRLLQESLCWPAQYPELFAQAAGCNLVTGLLLYGPPGCGKTRLGLSIASTANMNLITVKGPELLSKYIGQSEENVRDAFIKASKRSPCLLFFDEFDALAPCRGHDSTGVTDRVVNQLLTQLDGVEGRQGVWVMAATCRPDLLDPALLRPGRLEKSIYCPLPSESDRAEILDELSKPLHFAEEINWSSIAKITPHLSGADLQSVLTTAQINAAKDTIGDDLYSGVIMDVQDLNQAAEETRSGSVSKMGARDPKGMISSSTAIDVGVDYEAVQLTGEEGDSVLSNGSESGSDGSFVCVCGGVSGNGAEDAAATDTNKMAVDAKGEFCTCLPLIPNENAESKQITFSKSSQISVENQENPQRCSSEKDENPPSEKDGNQRSAAPQIEIRLSHVLAAVMEVTPSVSEVDRQRYERLHDSFSQKKKGSFVTAQPGLRATLA